MKQSKLELTIIGVLDTINPEYVNGDIYKTFIGIDGSSKRLSLNFFGYIPGELLGEKVSLYECEKDSGNVNTGKILNQRLVIKDTYSSKYRIDATSSEDYRSKY